MPRIHPHPPVGPNAGKAGVRETPDERTATASNSRVNRINLLN
jgi:hypothetical protein